MMKTQKLLYPYNEDEIRSLHKQLLPCASTACCLVFLVLCYFNLTSGVDNNLRSKEHAIVGKLFGGLPLNVSSDELIQLESFLYTILSSSPYQLYYATHQAHKCLKELLAAHKIMIADLKATGQQVTLLQFYKGFIIHKQLKHLKYCSKKLLQQLTIKEKTAGTFKHYIDHYKKTISSYINKKDKADDMIDEIRQCILQYAAFERASILLDYHTVRLYFQSPYYLQLPEIIRFWQHAPLQSQMVRRAKKVTPQETVEVNFIQDLVMVFSQALLMGGSQLYNEWVNFADEEFFKQLNDQQRELAHNFQLFLQRLGSEQNTIITNIFNGFDQSIQNLNNTFNSVIKKQQDEVTFLFQSINIDTPLNKYIRESIYSDQIFEASIMETPAPHTWYNVDQIGDWEFDPFSNSFWQNKIALFTPLAWNDENNKKIPFYNAIFTEYISNLGKNKYDIEIECNIITAQFPFFAGFMFNKARWISGSLERMSQYRLVGIYGSQTNMQDPSTRSLDFCFAQQIIEPPTDATKEGAQGTITTPLEQIASQDQTRLFHIDAEEIGALEKDPLTYVFKISTMPQEVTLTLSKKIKINDVVTYQDLYSTTLSHLNNKNPYQYIFDGIGFMAPGCAAQFTIRKPVDLIYTQSALDIFTATVVT